MLTDENEENRNSSDEHKSITFEDFILMNDLDLDEETNTTNTEDNKRKSAEDVNQSRMKKVRVDAAGTPQIRRIHRHQSPRDIHTWTFPLPCPLTS